MYKIGVVDIRKRKGGVRTFIDNFSCSLRKRGYTADILDLSKTPLSILNSYDILHFSEFWPGWHAWKLLFLRHPKKILTIHGAVEKEIKHRLKKARLPFSDRIIEVLNWLLWCFAWLPFDEITCPSARTAGANGLRARMRSRARNVKKISNGIFPDEYREVTSINVKSNSKQVVFVTYSNFGGLEDEGMVRVINVIKKLNQFSSERSIILLVFGLRPPGAVSNRTFRFLDRVNHSVFLGFLKGSDLFITGKPFSDLGYTEMEAGALGTPIAKFVIDGDFEELIEDITGILSRTEDDMVRKLLEYTANVEILKPKMGIVLRNYIFNVKSWEKIIPIWLDLFSRLLKEKT